MKRFKLFLLLAALFCGSTTFVGCSDDDDGSGSSLLVGTWENAMNGGTVMTISSDGSISSRDSFYSMTGTWHYNDSTQLLTITWKANAYNSGGTQIYYVTVLTETQLVYTTTYIDGGNITYNFTRKY